MKKALLILLTLVPIALGRIISLTALVPTVGMTLLYVVPIINAAYWFYLGYLYSKTNWGFVPAVLIGNAVAILSQLLYMWEFIIKTDETRNLTLAGVSQAFNVAAPTMLSTAIVLLFQGENDILRGTMAAIQSVSTILMIIIFAAGYLMGKMLQKQRAAA